MRGTPQIQQKRRRFDGTLATRCRSRLRERLRYCVDHPQRRNL